MSLRLASRVSLLARPIVCRNASRSLAPALVQRRHLATEKVWELGILNHVAIAVPDIEKSAKFYKEVMRAKVSDKHALPEHGVYTVFVELGNTKIELLHPYGEKSPIANFLAKNKDGGMHHICLEASISSVPYLAANLNVDNVYTAMEDVKQKGIRCLDKEPKIGAHGKPVVFLHPKDCGGVLVELEQR
ncbi:hypothetical protein HDU97_008235 [Phlyctochytrium planicorne]|nr:hypothetical protein HDU97_008235 [Phlyctochytrium planicorne]